MTQRATLKDVARIAGISLSTASLVMRGSAQVAAETRRRVLAAAETAGYVYNRSAANLRTRTSHTVGLVVCDITNPFYAEFTAGIEATLDREGVVTFLCNTAESRKRQELFLTRMSEQNVDGIIISPADATEVSDLARLSRAGVPVVQALRYLNGAAYDFVGVDSRLGFRMAVDHLVRAGHRRIAYVGDGRKTSSSRDRRLGFITAMNSNGLVVGPGYMVDGQITRDAGAKAVDQLLLPAEPPTAVVCFSDIIALGVLWRLKARGIQPGRDFAVIGHDNIEESLWSTPALTTISISPRKLGEEAARMLVRRIRQPDAPAERVILPPQLIVRGSCGGPADVAMGVEPGAGFDRTPGERALMFVTGKGNDS